MTNITIHAAVIHEIKKDQHTVGDENISVVNRHGLHQHNPLLEQFVQKIDSDNRRATGFSSRCLSFTQEDSFGKVISDYFINESSYNLSSNSYLNLSINLVNALAQCMSKVSAATGGHIPVLWYERDNTKYLMIGLVNPSGGFTIDNSGSIISNTNIDKAALRFSLCVELNYLVEHHKFVFDPNNSEANEINDIVLYVQWTKKREDIAHYFQEYLPIDQLINDGDATRKFINRVEAYLDSIIPKTAPYEHIKAKANIQQKIYRKMEQCLNAGDSVIVTDDIVPIFEEMIDEYPNVFMHYDNIKEYYEFCEDNNYENYNSPFNAKRNDLAKVLKFKISIGKNMILDGFKEDITETTKVVAYNNEDDETCYRLVSEITETQYNDIISKIPEIQVVPEESIDYDITES